MTHMPAGAEQLLRTRAAQMGQVLGHEPTCRLAGSGSEVPLPWAVPEAAPVAGTSHRPAT